MPVPASSASLHSVSGFAQKARLAVAWTTGLNVFRDAVQFGLMIVMVRLLAPEAYGQFGLMNTIISFMMVFSSREFIAHTLLIRDDDDLNYQEQFAAGCVIQGALFVLANIAAVALRWAPTYAPIAPLLHLMSLLFLFDLPSELRTKMLERALDWRRLRTIEAIGIAVSAVVTLSLGLAGAGVYALLVPGFILPALFLFDLFVVAGWRPTFRWHAGRYRASRIFGLNRVASATLVTGSSLLESGVLAHAVGYAALGIFGRANGMAALFCIRVSALLMAALYPVLARIPARTDAFQRIGGLVLRIVAWTVVPVALLLSLVGDRFVLTLYGSRWTAVIPLVPWAMGIGACLACVQTCYYLLLAHENSRDCLRADIWRLIGMALALALALRFGLVPYLGAIAVVHGVALIMLVHWLVAGGALRYDSLAAAFMPPAAAAVLAGIGAEATRRLGFGDLAPLPLLLAYGSVFGIIYVATLRLLFGRLLRELVTYLPKGDAVQRLLGFPLAAPAPASVVQ
jgi:O-antigen/teichoic acid export membrane protein